VTVLADVAVEAQSSEILSFGQSFALQKINRKDCRMPAVATAKRKSAIFEIGKPGDRPTGYRDDPGHPAHVCIAHRDRPARAFAPSGGLDKSEVCIPSDVDARQRIARPGEERRDLVFIALKQRHLHGETRLLVKVPPHALPDADHLRIVCDRTYPDCPA